MSIPQIEVFNGKNPSSRLEVPAHPPIVTPTKPTKNDEEERDNVRQAILVHYDLQESDKSIPEIEEEARNRQPRILAQEIAKKQNMNLETLAGHIDDETRRPPFDLWSTFKRSFNECQRYIKAMRDVKADAAELALLQELVKSWTTLTNFEHLATVLNFSQKDVEILIAELEQGKGINPEQQIEELELDKSAPWYKDVLAAIAADDIIPLVMMRELIQTNVVTIRSAVPWFKSFLIALADNDMTPGSVKRYIVQNFETIRRPNEKVRPVSLRQLFTGLQNYIERETLTIVDSGESEEVVALRLQELSDERRKLYNTLRGMNRERKTIF